MQRQMALIFSLLVVLAVATNISASSAENSEEKHYLNKRVLPSNQYCDPDSNRCRKGDWVAEHIADCEFDRSLFHLTCNAVNDVPSSWTVDVAVDNRCKPSRGTRFKCGALGTNTRCVCSDTNLFYNLGPNSCKCQYWPSQDFGVNMPAFCTGYYAGGQSTVHHWACCNNCNDPTPNTCDGTTWQGGSSISYCGQCGQNTGGGRDKYYFNCGGCDEQQMCDTRCTNEGLSIPGLCWKWLDCFKGCCNEMNTLRRKRQANVMITFCGDGNCTASKGETPSSCPIDCCYKVNSTCSNILTQCTPSCCQNPSCCAQSEASESGEVGIYFGNFKILVGTLAAFLITCYY